ncbi:MAG: S9 family peptidase [Planctomycetota bacterium]
MISYINRLFSILILIITVAGAWPLQAGEKKKVVTMDDYGLWRTVSSAQLSSDGKWMTYDYRKPEADEDATDERNLQIKHLFSDQVYQVPFGISPSFSDDSRWVAYKVDLDRKEAKKLKDQEKPVQQKVQLLNLETGDKITWENTASFVFSKSSNALAVGKPKSKGAKHKGSDLIIYDIKRKFSHHFGSVSSHSFNKQGTLLAYTRDAADKTANGLYIMNLKSGLRTPLDQDEATYSQMTWDEEGTALAVLKGNKDEKFLQRENQLIAFTGLGGGSPSRHELNSTENKDFPKDMVISEKGKLSWNSDATKVFFGIKEQKPDPKHEKSDKENKENKEDKDNKDGDKKSSKKSPVSDLDIWHWKDVRIQSVQRARANREKNRTYRSVFNLMEKQFVQLADESMKQITITLDGKWGVGSDDRQYIHDWKPHKADYYRVDTNTGERQLMLTAHQSSLSQWRRGRGGSALSPDNKHFAYWQDANIWVYNLDSGKAINLTEDAPVSFINTEWDYYGEKPSYGLSGWSKDGKNIILNHRYDLWLQPLDGRPATNLTGGVGAKNEIRLRYVKLDREEKYIDLSKSLMLSAYGQWTKKAGFYKLDARQTASGKFSKPEPLIFKDKSFGRLVKAKNAGRFMVTIQSFSEYPDYYVTDATFRNPKRITHANPQQKEYHWGRRVLFDYTNKDGVRLQGALAIPDTRKPGERLPMLVSFYEKTSQYMHHYDRPRYASGGAAHLMEAVSKGYLLLSPDVHFRIGSTMEDMFECVEAAVDKAIELGYADPDRIGLMGHSFSGTGAVYIAARSKKFAAVSAGASSVDPSGLHHLWGYSADRKTGSGVSAHQYEIYGQGRMGAVPIEDFDAYSRGAFIDLVPEMTTPLLLIQGEADDIVEWMEAVGIYNAMRFYGKKIIFLSYPGEGHGLAKRVNRIDLTRRMIEYFDHYLKGKPAADWMTNGVPFLEKESSKTDAGK